MSFMQLLALTGNYFWECYTFEIFGLSDESFNGLNFVSIYEI